LLALVKALPDSYLQELNMTNNFFASDKLAALLKRLARSKVTHLGLGGIDLTDTNALLTPCCRCSWWALTVAIASWENTRSIIWQSFNAALLNALAKCSSLRHDPSGFRTFQTGN
jgi:hypothetical protein